MVGVGAIEIEIEIGIGIEKWRVKPMGLGHEKRDAYRLAIGDVAWGYEKADGLTGNRRSARDQTGRSGCWQGAGRSRKPESQDRTRPDGRDAEPVGR